MSPWAFLPIGYTLSVLCEAPVLYFGLSAQYSLREKLWAAIWLTACTYPVVILTLPSIAGRYYTLTAEIFAPIAECLLFAGMFSSRWGARDMAAIVAANLTSFAVGLVLFA